MKNLILVILAAFAFAVYSIPFSKISRWEVSMPLMIIGGAVIYMMYMGFVEKVNFLTPSPYSMGQLLPPLIFAMAIYAMGFLTFGKLLSLPDLVKVQLYVALVTALIPLFALVVPVIMKREMISMEQGLGLVLVVSGVYFLNKG